MEGLTSLQKSSQCILPPLADWAWAKHTFPTIGLSQKAAHWVVTY